MELWGEAPIRSILYLVGELSLVDECMAEWMRRFGFTQACVKIDLSRPLGFIDQVIGGSLLAEVHDVGEGLFKGSGAAEPSGPWIGVVESVWVESASPSMPNDFDAGQTLMKPSGRGKGPSGSKKDLVKLNRAKDKALACPKSWMDSLTTYEGLGVFTFSTRILGKGKMATLQMDKLVADLGAPMAAGHSKQGLVPLMEGNSVRMDPLAEA
ncbi:hypothetical protein COCNU_scaffold003395G000010 [Cocos nucifera]|nr:hypothetical protein [Cocos nucifera]